MTTYGIKIADVAGVVIRRQKPPVGKWVASFDPDARGGFGEVVVTGNPAQALHFETQAAALTFWRKQSTVRPTRDDGEPNRPLTAYTVEIGEVK